MCHIRSCLLTILCLLAVPTAPCAQKNPDFSGRWILEAAPGTDPDAPKALTVRQSEATIAIERDLPTGPTRETHEIGLVGGYVSGTITAAAQRHRTHQSVTWQDRALVFEQSSQVDTGAGISEGSERREVWALDDDGRLRVTIVTRSSGTATRTTTAGYRR